MRRLTVSLILLVLSACAATERRQPAVSRGDAQRVIADPGFLEQYAATRRFSQGRPRSMKIVPDGSAVLFLRSPADSFVQDLYEFDTATGEERRLLTATQILDGAQEHLSVEEKARRERMRLVARGIASYRLSEDGSRILVGLSGRLFVVERAGGKVTELKSDNGYALSTRFSPDGQSIACVRNKEVYVIDIRTGLEWQLTVGSGEHVTNGLSEFVAQEEMRRYTGFWWSPDNRLIAYQQTDTSGVELMHIADATHPDRKPHTWPYPRAGKTNAKVRLGVVPVKGGDTVWVQWDQERYPYLATVKWKKNAPLTILVQNRTQTEEVLLSIDPYTGESTPLLTERDDAWINLDQRMPHWLPDGSAFLWKTERGGAWELELRDRYGKLVAPLTTPQFRCKGFVSYEEKDRVVYVRGSDDPTQTHLYRIPIDEAPATPVRLTEDPGVHYMTFSKDHSVYLHTGSSIKGSRFNSVRRKDGTVIGRLESVGQKAPFVPNAEFTTAGRSPKFHAVLIRPRNFEHGRRYPVLLHVYGGPHGQMVSASPNRYLIQQWFADHGFIVVSLDGRGTPNRGRPWERVIKGNLIDIPLQDQVAGLKALGRKYRELDLDHVGVYGGSFGGYFAAMAVMRRPDVFHAGVAQAPVCDWLDYDSHYTERYMGLPHENAAGYEASNVLTYAGELSQPLLIIHGTADDNVYFAHSLKMSNALFRAGKEHEFLPLTGFTHMVPDPLVTKRLETRIVNFFEKHLMAP